jgi:hypothetical protein
MEFTRYGFTLYEVSEWEKYMAEAGFKDIQSLLFKEADRFTAEGLLEMECVVCSGNKA